MSLEMKQILNEMQAARTLVVVDKFKVREITDSILISLVRELAQSIEDFEDFDLVEDIIDIYKEIKDY